MSTQVDCIIFLLDKDLVGSSFVRLGSTKELLKTYLEMLFQDCSESWISNTMHSNSCSYVEDTSSNQVHFKLTGDKGIGKSSFRSILWEKLYAIVRADFANKIQKPHQSYWIHLTVTQIEQLINNAHLLRYTTYAWPELFRIISESPAIRLNRHKSIERRFTAIYTQYRAFVLRAANKYVIPDDAEDITHDVFLELWKHLQGCTRLRCFCNGSLSPNKWLAKATMYSGLKVLKQKKRMQEMLMRWAEINQELLVDNPFFFPADVHKQQQIYDVMGQINHLPIAQRETLLLSYIEGLTHEQIAEKLNVALGTIKARACRGRMALRERLGIASPEKETSA